KAPSDSRVSLTKAGDDQCNSRNFQTRPLSVAVGLVQSDWVRQAHQLNESDIHEPYRRVLRGSYDVVADQDLPRPRVRGDPGGRVDRPTEVVAVLQDHRARIYPRMGRRKTSGRHAVGQLER